MEILDKNRIKINELLYSNLICKAITLDTKELNVLLIGDDIEKNSFFNEAFKAVFWCGQFPDTTLNITICPENIDDCENILKAQMPGLEQFANFNNSTTVEKPSANIFIKNKSELNFDRYGCVFVCFTDEKINSDIKKQASKHCDYVIDISNEVKLDDNSELKRLAENINFAYEMRSNERANFNKVNEFFNELDTPKTTEDVYKIYSSYASAVHIAYKLEYCRAKYPNANPEEILVKAVNAAKNETGEADQDFVKLYNDLVVLEHRRWMAYTISEGWKKPTKEKLEEYLYKNGNTHKNIKEKYHACLYDCSEKPNNLYDAFNEIFHGGQSPDKLENLDDVSLFCYKKLCNEANKIDINKEFDLYLDIKVQSLKTTDRKLELIYHSAVQMIDNIDNSVKLYEVALKELITNDPTIKEKVKNIDDKLKLVKERNKKTNFLKIDAQLIDLIPFCLWYRKKYKAVITISDGNVLDDIAVPILSGAEYHTVLLKTKTGYSEKISTFLENYYDTDDIKKIVKIDIKDSMHLKNGSVEDDYITKYQNAIDERISVFHRNNLCDEDIIINVVPHSMPEAIMAVEKYKSTHPIVSYKQSGIKCYNNMMNDYYGIGDVNLSVNEWLELCGWNLTEQGYGVMPCNKMDKLSNLFWEVSEPKVLNQQRYTIWQKMHEHYKDNHSGKISWNNSSSSEYKEDINKNIPDLLNALKEIKIIENLILFETEQRAEFSIKDDAAYSILSHLSGTFFENIVYYKCKYSTLFYEVRTGVKIKIKDSNKKPNTNNSDTNNEIDVIAINGTKPILISCKSTASLDKPVVYEIHSEAKLFGGIPVLAVSQTLAEKKQKGEITPKHQSFIDRAKEWGVSLLDANIIKDDKKFFSAMKRILLGEIVSPLDHEFHT